MAVTKKKIKILIVEDEHEIIELLTLSLKKVWDFEIDTCSEINIAASKLQKKQYDICFIDLQLHCRRKIGFRLIKPCRDNQTIPIIVTGTTDERIEIHAFARGVWGYIKKSDVDFLEQAIASAINGLARRNTNRFCSKYFFTSDVDNRAALETLYCDYINKKNNVYFVAGHGASQLCQKLANVFTAQKPQLFSEQSAEQSSDSTIVSTSTNYPMLTTEFSTKKKTDLGLLQERHESLTTPTIVAIPDRELLSKAHEFFPEAKVITIKESSERHEDFLLMLKTDLSDSGIAIGDWAYEILKTYNWPKGEASVISMANKLKKFKKPMIVHTDLPKSLAKNVIKKPNFTLVDFPKHLLDLVDEKGLTVGMIEIRKKIIWHFYNYYGKSYTVTAKKLRISVSVIWEAINE